MEKCLDLALRKGNYLSFSFALRSHPGRDRRMPMSRGYKM